MILPVINLSSYNIYQAKNTSFTGTPQYQGIKNLPRLTCPRCGGPIIAPQELVETYRKIALPLKYMIQKGYMDKAKNMPVMWNFLNSLAEKNPDSSLDEILEKKELHDKLRILIESIVHPGISRDNQIAYDAYKHKFKGLERGILNSSQRELSKAPEVIKNIEPFIQYLRKIEQTEPFKTEVQSKIGAFEYLAHYAAIYPDKRLSEIVNIPEIKSHILSMKKILADEFNAKHREIFDNFRKIITENTDSSETLIKGVICSAKTALFKSSKDPGIRLSNALRVCKSFTEQNGCPEIYDELANLIIQIYEIPFNKYNELANYIGEQDDGKIVDGLIKQYTGSTHLIKPKSEGGSDARQNKMSMHKGCHAKCGDTPKEELCHIYPEFPNNACKQIEQVSGEIYLGHMPKYYLYPIQAANNIKKESNGVINPDASEYCEKIISSLSEKADKNADRLCEIIDMRDSKITKLAKTDDKEKQSVLRAEIEKINEDIQKLRADSNEINGLINALINSKAGIKTAK